MVCFSLIINQIRNDSQLRSKYFSTKTKITSVLNLNYSSIAALITLVLKPEYCNTTARLLRYLV